MIKTNRLTRQCPHCGATAEKLAYHSRYTLLIGAGLMLRSLFKLQEVNPGFDPQRVLVMRVTANWSKYTTGRQCSDLGLRLIERAQAVPGVLSAAMASTYPLNPLGLANEGFNVNFQTLACLVPARRATLIDPLTALRSE